MNMPDWLDDLLDRHPGEHAPAGFLERVRDRADHLQEEAPVLRPGFRRWVPAAAAAILFLAIGFWLGQGGRTDLSDAPLEGAPTAVLDDELEFYRALDLVMDESLELAWSQETIEEEE